MARYNNEDGVWRTIKGRHIFIKTGESLDSAMEREGIKSSKKKSREKMNIKELNEHDLGDKYKGKGQNPNLVYSNGRRIDIDNQGNATIWKDGKIERKTRLPENVKGDKVKDYFDDSLSSLDGKSKVVERDLSSDLYTKGGKYSINNRPTTEEMHKFYDSIEKWEKEKKPTEENVKLMLHTYNDYTLERNEDRQYEDYLNYKNSKNSQSKVVNSRKIKYDGSYGVDKTDAIKLQMGHGLSNDAVKGYAKHQAYGLTDKNVNQVIQELNDEGSDFTFGEATIKDGRVKTSVGVFFPDKRGYTERELEVPLNGTGNMYGFSAKMRDWESRHSTPDTFYDKDFYAPEKVNTQGKSTRKEVKNKIQQHILEYYGEDYTGEKGLPADDAFVRQMDAMGEINNWNNGKRIAEGGSYLIYTEDMRNFLDSLNINPKGKKFSDDKVFSTYTNLIGRESANLYDKIQKQKLMNESQLVKAYIDRGYSEATAKRMAKQAIKARKR